MANDTHYDNLNVARDASSDAIRAAYKAHIQKYETASRQNADTLKATKAVGKSFAVLSNPVQRAAYDRWLLAQETAAPIHANDGESKSRSRRWLMYLLIGLLVLMAATWFGLSNRGTESNSDDTFQEMDSAHQQSAISQPETTQDTPSSQATESAQFAPMVVAESVPEHDQVAIEDFIGSWNGGNGKTAGRQSLNISMKSVHSLVFRLDAKSGQKTGSVYGIAEFANSFANFYNKEYDCSILFTIKSDVLHLDTTSCQEYHEPGVSFDGDYKRPAPEKAAMKASPVKGKTAAKSNAAKANQTPPSSLSSVEPQYTQKLLKFVATVKDADGNLSKIELIAKDKDAARIIIRDFRGNPKIVRIKEVRQ